MPVASTAAPSAPTAPSDGSIVPDTPAGEGGILIAAVLFMVVVSVILLAQDNRRLGVAQQSSARRGDERAMHEVVSALAAETEVLGNRLSTVQTEIGALASSVNHMSMRSPWRLRGNPQSTSRRLRIPNRPPLPP